MVLSADRIKELQSYEGMKGQLDFIHSINRCIYRQSVEKLESFIEKAEKRNITTEQKQAFIARINADIEELDEEQSRQVMFRIKLQDGGVSEEALKEELSRLSKLLFDE